MLISILKRYPELTEDDVILRDDGDEKGIYIDVWNSDKPKPTIDEVYQWVQEDDKLPKPPTLEERISELENMQNLQLLGVL